MLNLPVRSINALEAAALAVLDYNISVSNEEWTSWLHSLHCYTKNDDLPHVRTILVDLLVEANMAYAPASRFRQEKPIARPTALALYPILNFRILLDIQVLISPRLKSASMYAPVLNEPAPWNPEADPIVSPVRGSLAQSAVGRAFVDMSNGHVAPTGPWSKGLNTAPYSTPYNTYLSDP